MVEIALRKDAFIPMVSSGFKAYIAHGVFTVYIKGKCGRETTQVREIPYSLHQESINQPSIGLCLRAGHEAIKAKVSIGHMWELIDILTQQGVALIFVIETWATVLPHFQLLRLDCPCNTVLVTHHRNCGSGDRLSDFPISWNDFKGPQEIWVKYRRVVGLSGNDHADVVHPNGSVAKHVPLRNHRLLAHHGSPAGSANLGTRSVSTAPGTFPRGPRRREAM